MFLQGISKPKSQITQQILKGHVAQNFVNSGKAIWKKERFQSKLMAIVTDSLIRYIVNVTSQIKVRHKNRERRFRNMEFVSALPRRLAQAPRSLRITRQKGLVDAVDKAKAYGRTHQN